MRAVICRAWGPVANLNVEDVPAPAPADDEVLIDVQATSVNYADSIMVAGQYQTRPTFPFSPGLETAGVVSRCGARATRFKPGDRVMATLAWGGLAEQAVAKEAETFFIPDGMPFEEAGAFPIAYISSDVALRWQGRLERDETLLVLGAAGGVGLTAVEIGKAMGARVIAGASTAEKLAVAQAHGAHALVNYATEKLTERVMALTGDKGADVCFDPVGGAVLHEEPVGGDLRHAALGSSLRHYRFNEPDKLRRSVEALVAWYREGKLRPLISHRFPLERTVEAITLLTDRKAHGKIVVLPGAR
jgi:NADPH2:quinone reductase